MNYSLQLIRAKDGGFIVMNDGERGMMRELLFAGSIDEALAYMKSRMAEPQP